jgi:protein O-GlcNAc transferase
MSAALLFKTAFQAHQAGDLATAHRAYLALLEQHPTHFDALHMCGVLAMQKADFATAAALIERAVRQHAGFALAWQNLATAYQGLARPADAAHCLLKKLTLAPPDAATLQTLAELQTQAGQPAPAANTWRQLLTLDADDADAWAGLGVAQRELGHTTDALASFEHALAITPAHAGAACQRGMLLCLLHRHEESLAQLDALLRTQPDMAAAHNARALTLWRLQRLDDAQAAYDRAIALDPNHAEALCNRAALLATRGRHDAARADYQRSLALQPERAETHDCLGALHHAQHQFDAAVHSYSRAVSLQPNNPHMIGNLGAALADAGRAGEALAHLDGAIVLARDAVDRDGSLSASVQTLANAWSNRSQLWAKLGQYAEAASDARHALTLEPQRPYAAGNALYFELMQCQWAQLDVYRTELQAALAAAQPVATPFVALAVGASPALQLACATRYAAGQFAPTQPHMDVAPASAFAAAERIRLALVSSDLHDHATAHLITGFVEHVDRSRFEVTAISYGPITGDAYQQRLRAACTQFIDVREQSDSQVCDNLRHMGTHIAVDLKGFTHNARPGIFSQRCAPIQVNYLGYPGTSGMPGMDYFLADAIALPRDMDPHFSECIVRLPHSYQCNDATRKIAARSFSRAELGLPGNAFVFCCFNNSYKITPQVFDIWMRLLQQVPDSVLWLLQDNSTATENLRREAMARGVDASRLVFAPRLATAEHLARQQLADLFLDTWPVNAHTTASDALWAGLPLITLQASSFAGRVAASLLHAVNRADCVATDAAQYEALALALAREPARLQGLRQGLAQARSTAPLFDTARSTRHLEDAFARMAARWRAGLKPMAFDVPA